MVSGVSMVTSGCLLIRCLGAAFAQMLKVSIIYQPLIFMLKIQVSSQIRHARQIERFYDVFLHCRKAQTDNFCLSFHRPVALSGLVRSNMENMQGGCLFFLLSY